MPAANLRQVRTFKDLIRYLEEELHWPIEGYEMEDLTFDYEPADLGLKDGDAAKVKTIRQLRPLASDQPWGIFFIEFDKKKLPVVLLRRILSHLVVKKRASANNADRAAWNAEDLLFVSAFGPEDEDGREIGFAHFHQESGDLPSLRVLGWDGADTSMKLNTVAATLRERLSWPEKGEKLDAWQQRWAGAFKHRIGHIIRTSDMLAEAMAALAKRIRDAATTIMHHETERGPLTKLHRAFQTNLIHDLTPDGFADTYAQTITYGLFTAALSKTDMSGGRHGTALIASNIIDMVPVTNPFLKEMLSTFLSIGGRKGGIDFDELGIQDVVELLRGSETDLPAIRDDFGNRTRGEDPVIHFYEHFLTAYNKKLKIQRGVFYTPQPVVSYIVRSVHELLQTEFGLADGLADTTTWGEMLKKHPDLQLPPLTDEPGEKRPISPDEMFVQILDPATGTATFLVEVIDVVFNHLKAKWVKGGLTAMPVLPGVKTGDCKQFTEYWNLYVPAALLPRLHAYELMMAPYAIAHMKIGLKLAETGYRFGTEERARIYLTNALEPWVKQLPLIGFDALAHEAAAVNEIKRHKRFTVVIGNPPYSNFGMMNKIPFIMGLLEDYKRGLDEKKLNLDDDFIKFMRLAQWAIATTGCGVIGAITNNTFIDGITHRQMRAAIRSGFPKIFVLDLHGSSSKKETCPDGTKDENVFDIQQGVGVSLFVSKATEHSHVSHADVWGVSGSKYIKLEKSSVLSTEWKKIIPEQPYHFFVPKDFRQLDEYSIYPSLTDVFSVNGPGVKTERDGVSIHWRLDELKQAVKAFKEVPEDHLRAQFELGPDSRDWKITNAKADVIKNDKPACYTRISYRPFDERHIWYSGQTRGFVGTPGFPVMQHMLRPLALGLLGMRQFEYDVPDYCYVFVSRFLIDNRVFVSNRGIANIFPLYTGDVQDADQGELLEHSSTNLKPAFLRQLGASLKLTERGGTGLPAGLTPEDIFHYAYAVFHSPGYRCRYAEFLKIDFPRLPLTGNLELFRALARLGGELTALHLLESPKLALPITTFIGSSKEVTKVGYSNNTVWINASGTRSNTTAGTSGFRGVPAGVWNFHIGGYQVCEKWLKDRKGRTLTDEDIAHYHKVVIALTETIRLMAEIDEVIDQHGGWPGAFQTTDNT
jgi:hypothetical protein